MRETAVHDLRACAWRKECLQDLRPKMSLGLYWAGLVQLRWSVTGGPTFVVLLLSTDDGSERTKQKQGPGHH